MAGEEKMPRFAPGQILLASSSSETMTTSNSFPLAFDDAMRDAKAEVSSIERV